MAFQWDCPYCHRACTIGDANFSTGVHFFHNENRFGNLGIKTLAITCPNPSCKEPTISAMLFKTDTLSSGQPYIPAKATPIMSWPLRPQSQAKQFPDYIPVPIKQDYEEACLIRDLSPKASATLSRRCLQGIIRDYWGISKSRLIDEIISIKEMVDPLTYQSIDAVRSIGNIGAHMEKDINQMIDVDPSEAGMLIGLVELLIKDWYITRFEREQRMKELVAVAMTKKMEK